MPASVPGMVGVHDNISTWDGGCPCQHQLLGWWVSMSASVPGMVGVHAGISTRDGECPCQHQYLGWWVSMLASVPGMVNVLAEVSAVFVVNYVFTIYHSTVMWFFLLC